MSYDDPNLSEFRGYFKAKEPGKRARAEAWATAIGLQKVDGLSVSRYLVATAKDHIEGRITQAQAKRRIHDYYEAKDERHRPDPDLLEPDKVSERIAAVINDGGFAFSPTYLKSIHRKLFRGVLQQAGEYRTVNVRKHEWVLREDSVTYASADDIAALLKSDFEDEAAFEYAGKSAVEIIPHFASFVSAIWQRHPFREGNSRTTAVFAVKYLRQLGYSVTNNMFAEHSWYFRNALVRANYMGLGKNAGRTTAYLIAFFRNLLLGEKNELKNRYLLIGIDRPPPKFDDGQFPQVVRKGGQKKWSEKGGQKKAVGKGVLKTADRLFGLVARRPSITQLELMTQLGIKSRSAVQKHIANLKKAGRLRRVGPDKGGHWEIVEQVTSNGKMV